MFKRLLKAFFIIAIFALGILLGIKGEFPLALLVIFPLFAVCFVILEKHPVGATLIVIMYMLVLFSIEFYKLYNLILNFTK